MSKLRESLDANTLYERRRALRALLQQPLLQAEGAGSADFPYVRQHAAHLQEWLARFPGWSLSVDTERARLRKLPATLDDSSRPALDPKSGAPFSIRRYVLLCLALAALERAERQTTLGDLAERILARYAEDEAFDLDFDLKRRDARRDLVAVVRLLLHHRVLVRVHGDEAGFLREQGDALYTIQRPALAALLQARRGPSTIEAEDFEARLEALLDDEPVFTPGSPEEDEARTRRCRQRAYRRLLDDPIVYYDDLDEAERVYVEGQRSRLIEQVHVASGLHPEVRAEGIAMVDERGDATDLGLPEEGTLGHLTLLLCEHLAEHLRAAGAGAPIGWAALEQRTAELIVEHGKRWSKRAREPEAEATLSREVVDRLLGLRLVREAPDGVLPLPAIARFALDTPSPEEAP